jgi:hypothetical protein
LREVLEAPEQPDLLPAQAIKPAPGRLLRLVDEAAADLPHAEKRSLTFRRIF